MWCMKSVHLRVSLNECHAECKSWSLQSSWLPVGYLGVAAQSQLPLPGPQA